MFNKLLSVIIIFLLFFITSCARMNEDRVSIKINSNPSRSHLYINNAYYGQTPVDISLLPDSDINYKATIMGKNYQKTIHFKERHKQSFYIFWLDVSYCFSK